MKMLKYLIYSWKKLVKETNIKIQEILGYKKIKK